MFRAPQLSTRRPRRLPALLVVLGTLLAFSAPAQAAKISFSATDPKGDSKATPGHDITKIEASYDNSTGAVTATATMAAQFSKVDGLLNIIIGTTQNGVCNYSDPGLDGLPPFLQLFLINFQGTPAPPAWNYSPKELTGKPDLTESGTTISFKVPANAELANLPFDCVYAATAYENNNGGAIADDVAMLASTEAGGGDTGAGSGGGSGGGSGSGGGTVPVKIVTTEPDADKDGVADSADACPKVPGALANGCPAMKPADEFRLGAKRIVVDKLVPMTAKACPPRVRITVTSKGKKLGTGVFKVDQHGSFCRVQGVVRLKSRKAAVRVVTKGTGMKSIAKSVRR